MGKHYRALVDGIVKEDSGRIEAPIARSKKDRKKMAVDPEGREAVTEWTVLNRGRGVTLLDVHILTGRTHQIRVHMKSIGHTLFNDERYGGQEILRGDRTSSYKAFIHNCFALCPRQALHARTLGFRHPRTGQEMDFTSELPQDITQLLEKWRKRQ